MKQAVLGAARFHGSGAWPATWTPENVARNADSQLQGSKQSKQKLTNVDSGRPPTGVEKMTLPTKSKSV